MQHIPDYNFVGYLSHLGSFGLKVPSQEPKGLVCIIGYSCGMEIPGQVICNIYIQVLGGSYYLNTLAV